MLWQDTKENKGKDMTPSLTTIILIGGITQISAIWESIKLPPLPIHLISHTHESNNLIEWGKNIFLHLKEIL